MEKEEYRNIEEVILQNEETTKALLLLKNGIFCGESNEIFHFFTSHTVCYFMVIKDPFQKYINHKNSKKKLTTNVYTKLYPTGSLPGKFYDAAKVHKRSINDPVEELPLRRITSNVNTATYQLARYLTNIWSPLKS